MDILIIISVAISAFIATNIDDLFLLTVFFANPKYNKVAVIVGQYLGIISLILISIPVYIFKSSIPDFLMVLMGFIPLLIGLKEILDLFNNKTKSFQIPNENETENAFINPNESNPNENLENEDILAKEIYQKTFLKDNQTNSGKYRYLSWFSVALITISNGADNIGVYAPLFSNLNQSELLLTILIFLIMTGIWCFFAHLIIKNKVLGTKIEKYGHIILPFVLIFLGIGIIISNYLQI